MAGEFLRPARLATAIKYEKAGNSARAEEVIQGEEYEPILRQEFFHPEEESFKQKVEDTFLDALDDMVILEYEMALAAKRYEAMVDESIQRMGVMNNNVRQAKEKLMDLNMLCGEDSEFFAVRPIVMSDFQTESPMKDGILTGAYSESEDVGLEVLDVTGNGIEGNHYVYVNKKFLSDTVKTDERSAIVDGSTSSFYEYQRLRAEKRSEPHFALLNIDNADIFCTVTLKSSRTITSLNVQTGNSHIVIDEVLVSEDDGDYIRVFSQDMAIKEIDKNYTSGDNYIYGSGLIAFPASLYVKITFKTSDVSSDVVAFEYIPTVESFK